MLWALDSIAIGLLGVCCAAMANRLAGRHGSTFYWSLALVSLPAGLAVGLWSSLPRAAIAGLIIVIASAYWALSRYTNAYFSVHWRLALAIIAGLLPFAGALIARADAPPLTLCLLVAILINAELSLRFRQAWFALAALPAALLVPVLMGQGIISPPFSAAAQAWACVAGMVLLILWRFQVKGLGDSFDAVGVAGYLFALLVALGHAVESGPITVLAVSLVGAACLLYLSNWESPPAGFVYAGVVVASYALLQITDIFGWPLSLNSLILGTGGVLLYLTGWHSEDGQRSRALRYAGLIMAFAGIYPGFFSPVPPLAPVLALGAGGGLLWLEARQQSRPAIAELAGSILALAVDWLLRHYQITEVQWYTLPWAAYFAGLTYRRRDLEHDAYDLFAAIALAFLTIPLAVQALAPNGQSYALILIFESLGLILLGPATGYRLITRWGAVTFILSAYQLFAHVF